MFDLVNLSLLPRPSQVLQGSDGAKQVEEATSLDPALPNHLGINSNVFVASHSSFDFLGYIGPL